MDVLFETLADQVLAKYDAKSKITPASDEAVRNPASRSRHIPSPIRREVFRRDENACTYKNSNTGKSCSSKHALELDHLKPFSQGGDHTLENLTLRCRAHNQLSA